MARALIACPTLPAPDRGAAARAALQHSEVLLASGWTVTIVCERAEPADLPRARRLAALGVEVHADGATPDRGRLVRGGAFTAVFVMGAATAQPWLAAFRGAAPSAQIVLDLRGLALLRLARRRLTVPGDALRPEDAHAIATELNTCASADSVLCGAQRDRALVELLCVRDRGAHVVPLAWRGDATTEPAPLADRAGVLTVRADGIVEGVGRVPELRPYLDRARALIALDGEGEISPAVIDALAAGLPVVIDPEAAEALELSPRRYAAVADSPEATEHELTRLLRDDHHWRHVSAAGRAHALNRFHPDRVAAALDGALRGLT